MKTVMLILILTITSSCVTYDRCVNKFGRVPGDTIIMPYERIIPKDSIVTRLIIDSIPFLIPGDTVLISDPQSRAQIRYWRERYNNALHVQADCDSIVIRDTIRVPHPVILEPPPPGVLKRIFNHYSNFTAVAFPVFLLMVFLLIKFFTQKLK